MQHSSKTIQGIVEMRKAGFTLGEIITKTGLKKTTIYHHIQSIPKSDKLIEKVKEASRRTQKLMADRRRGKSIKKYKFNRPSIWTPNFVNLVAHFLFDGDIQHSGCCYNSRSSILLDIVKKEVEDTLSVQDYKLYRDKITGVFKLCYFHVEIASFIRSKSIELLDYIPTAPNQHKISFLRSFFDDEGCMTFNKSKNKRLLRGYQHSLSILRIVQELLLDFGIESRIDEKYFELYITRQENLLKFQKFINFTPGLCVNGNRSNSIWKKPLEKREILRMALASYQK